MPVKLNMTNMNLGEFIRQKRDEKNLSLSELARLISRSAPFLYDVEMGRRHPSDEVLVEIAKHLSVPTAELKQYDTRPPTKTVLKKTLADPQYAVALRKVIDSKLSATEVMEAVDKALQRKAKG